MEVIRNSLSEELYNACVDDLGNKRYENVWKSSNICWPEFLSDGVLGTVLCTEVSEVLSRQISREIVEYIPEYESISCQYYIWQKNSGIKKHDDGTHKFGATIYLNKNWDIDNGGFFIWKDKFTDELKVLSPEKNMMVLNSTEEEHLVTPLLPSSTDLRYTIQIWGN